MILNCRCAWLFVAIFLISGCGKAKPEKKEPPWKRYNAESGIIKYKIEGSQEGTETVYFDRWGMREARYSKVREMAQENAPVANRLAILDGDDMIYADLDRKTAVKRPNLLTLMTETEVPEGSAILEEVVMTRMGGKLVGKEEIAGYPCDLWEVQKMAMKACLWQWVPLRVESLSDQNAFILTATRVEINPVIPENLFSLPQDIQVIEKQDVDDVYFKAPNDSKPPSEESPQESQSQNPGEV